MMLRKCLYILFVFYLSVNVTHAQSPNDFEAILEALPQISQVKRIKENTYKIAFTQPLDHDNPTGKTFTQRLYLTHIVDSLPMVMVTEGYAAPRHYTYELSDILQSNQLIVEHRYFGESVPDTLDWNYLNTRQAANDHHRIVEAFKQIYPKKWLNTGISKGGQTAIYHRYYFPEDVDISVPYVAPLNVELEDGRLTKFLNKIGTSACRKKIFDYQRRMLEQREAILPLMKWYCIGKGQNFDIGREVAYEYAVLEYSFSFWQWGNDCKSIPGETATLDEMLQHLIDVVGFGLYTDKGVKYYHPFFHQAMTELGYYGFDTTGLRHLLQHATSPTNRIFAPLQNVEFDRNLNRNVQKWLRKSGDKMLYIYGELDTWSATAVEPSAKTDALKITLKNRAHQNARVKNMSPQDQRKTLETLKRWLSE